jgi:hypothetical protein
MKRILSLIALAVAPLHSAAFCAMTSSSILKIFMSVSDVPRAKVSLRQTTENVGTNEDTDDVTCYIVNDEEIITEGEKPHVVCTSEPDDVSQYFFLFHLLTSYESMLIFHYCTLIYGDVISVCLVQWHRSTKYEKD